MLSVEDLKDWLHRQECARYEKIMFVLAALGGGPVTLQQIKTQAAKAGWKIPKSWNISDTMSKSKGLIIKTLEGWELTPTGKRHLKIMGAPIDSATAHKLIHDLRLHLDDIKNPETKTFAEEAIKCFENGLWRSAIVMSWIGALHLLYDHVVKNKLSQFNAEATKINNKFKPVSTIDSLAKCMGETDFLNRLENISIITNSVKKELIDCLDRRNSCGHPNSYKPRQNTVIHHLEILLLNIYIPFKV